MNADAIGHDSDPLRERLGEDFDPIASVQRFEMPTDLFIDAARHDSRGRLDDACACAKCGRGRCNLKPDKAAANDQNPTARTDLALQNEAVTDIAKIENIGIGCARNGQRADLGTGGDHQMIIGDAIPVPGSHGLAGPIDGEGRVSGAKNDAMPARSAVVK